MIVLDTNVLSETMKPQPDANVVAWLDEQVSETLYLSSATMGELLFGVAAMPGGKRREHLTGVLEKILEVFEGRVLPFDAGAARQYAALATKARRAGKGFPLPDGYIAACAASRGFAVATRDTAPFAAAGLSVVNPWLRS